MLGRVASSFTICTSAARPAGALVSVTVNLTNCMLVCSRRNDPKIKPCSLNMALRVSATAFDSEI